MSNSLQPHELQHARPPCHHQLLEFTQTHVHWVGDAIQPSHPLLSPSRPALNPSQHQGLFQNQLFAWGQSIGVSASASVLPMNIQDWFPLGWTGWISLQSKGLLRVFSNTTVQKHLTLKRKGNSVVCYMNECWGHNDCWKKPVTERQILYAFIYMRYLQ